MNGLRSPAAALLIAAGLALAPPTLAAAGARAEQSYEALLARVRKADPTVDFKALRLAYTKSASYRPYAQDDARRDMIAAYGAKDFAGAEARAAKVLDANYLDIDAHIVFGMSAERLNDAAQAEFHRAVAAGLVNSILESGNGAGPDTAFVVIATDEEYTVLRELGLRLGSQSLVDFEGHRFDVLRVLDDKNKFLQLYFNIDLPFGGLKRSTGNPKALGN